MKNFWKKVKQFFYGKEILMAFYDRRTQVMTIHYTNKTSEEYKGSGTVWYLLPLMKRCETFEEGMLCEIWEYILEWGNPYPMAHQKGEPQIAKSYE